MLGSVFAQRPLGESPEAIPQRDLALELKRAKSAALDQLRGRQSVDSELGSRNAPVKLQLAQEALTAQEYRTESARREMEECARQLEALKAKGNAALADLQTQESVPRAARHEVNQLALQLEHIRCQIAHAAAEERDAVVGQQECMYAIGQLQRASEALYLQIQNLERKKKIDLVLEYRPWQQQENDHCRRLGHQLQSVDAQLVAQHRRLSELRYLEAFNREHQIELAQKTPQMELRLAEAHRQADSLARWYVNVKAEDGGKAGAHDGEVSGAEQCLQGARERLERETEALERRRGEHEEAKEQLVVQRNPLANFGCW